MLNFLCVRKYRTIIVLVVLAGLVASAAFFAFKLFKPKNAGILIETNPAASVFINDEQVGRTPYRETLKPREITVKLIPESIDKPLAPYETKVSLASGIETVIKRDFGETDETSSGEIVSFERVGGKAVELAVVSIPDGAQVSVDGDRRGTVPYKTSSITPGEHQLVVSFPGYFERTLTVKAVRGYKLTVVVKLAPSGEVQGEEDTKEEEEVKIEEVEISSTPTGFLRVRSGPSTANEEVVQVKPGERYPLLETDEETGWFKIEYEEGKEGWISNQYAKKVGEEEEGATPTPTKVPTPSPTEAETPTPTGEVTPTTTLTPPPTPTGP